MLVLKLIDSDGIVKCTRGVRHLWYALHQRGLAPLVHCDILKCMRKLEEELNSLAKSDMYPFHMPGHKRQDADPCGGPLHAARAWDITEIDGFDNLHEPEAVIKEEMERPPSVKKNKLILQNRK